MNDVKDCFNKLKECCEQVEEHVNSHILDKNYELHQFSQSYTALEKAKLYHYKEIIKNLIDIKTQISLVRFNFQKIEQFNRKQHLSATESKHYSYVTQQIDKFDSPKTKEVVRRESRRSRRNSDSNSSIDSLHTWEEFLVNKEKSESMPNLTSLSNVPKRSNSSNRRNKKFVSSTFNDILDQDKSDHSSFSSIEAIEEDYRSSGISDSSSLHSFQTAEDLDDWSDEDPTNNDLHDSKKLEARNYSLTDILDSLKEFNEDDENEENTKPKIVDVVLKNPSPTIDENKWS